jgi:hypothetical protein
MHRDKVSWQVRVRESSAVGSGRLFDPTDCSFVAVAVVTELVRGSRTGADPASIATCVKIIVGLLC